MGAQPIFLAQEFVTETCCVCNMSFAMTRFFRDEALEKHDVWFYCPQGHRQHYTGQSEEQKLRRQLELKNQELDWARKGRDKAQRSRDAVRGHLTRIKKRVANGVCPCCNRSFENLARHMSHKHPDFKKYKEG